MSTRASGMEGDEAGAIAIELMMFTGSRRGEMRALHWGDLESHLDGSMFWTSGRPTPRSGGSAACR